jgi:hypothetical protein
VRALRAASPPTCSGAPILLLPDVALLVICFFLPRDCRRQAAGWRAVDLLPRFSPALHLHLWRVLLAILLPA